MFGGSATDISGARLPTAASPAPPHLEDVVAHGARVARGARLLAARERAHLGRVAVVELQWQW